MPDLFVTNRWLVFVCYFCIHCGNVANGYETLVFTHGSIGLLVQARADVYLFGFGG